MNKKQDPRTVQTKSLIMQTLLDMLKKTAFDKITVSELCKIAGINRGTFYLHYCDLWAVLEELEEEALREEPSDEPYQCCLTAEHYECPYEDTVALNMTTLARNSPLSLAIAVVTFPEQPLISLAPVIGPLIELPVLSVISGILKRWNQE